MTPSPIGYNIGMDDFLAAVESERKSQGVSIRKLAHECGISRQYYHRLLLGEHAPTLQWCRRVASVLGLEITVVKVANPS